VADPSARNLVSIVAVKLTVKSTPVEESRNQAIPKIEATMVLIVVIFAVRLPYEAWFSQENQRHRTPTCPHEKQHPK